MRGQERLQFRNDGVDDVSVGAVAAFHVDMGFLVGWATFFRQSVENSLRIISAELDTRIPT
jgi:hypothetical protein